MWRVLFLILVVMSSLTAAQSEQKTKPVETLKVSSLEEFGKVPLGQIRSYLDNFFTELQKNPTAHGYIFNYGAKREVASREKLFRGRVVFLKVNASQITFARGKNETELRTQLWIVPKGAEPPTP